MIFLSVVIFEIKICITRKTEHKNVTDQIPQNFHYPTNYFKLSLYGYYKIRTSHSHKTFNS